MGTMSYAFLKSINEARKRPQLISNQSSLIVHFFCDSVVQRWLISIKAPTWPTQSCSGRKPAWASHRKLSRSNAEITADTMSYHCKHNLHTHRHQTHTNLWNCSCHSNLQFSVPTLSSKSSSPLVCFHSRWHSALSAIYTPNPFHREAICIVQLPCIPLQEYHRYPIPSHSP